MAKDGTARGGHRIGAGRKKAPLADKVNNGTAEKALVLPEPTELKGAAIPKASSYLKSTQKDGSKLPAEKIYKKTYEWLRTCNCDKLVSQQLIEQYAMSVSRYVQCEEALSEYGFLAKHPTTGAAIASPYVQMSQNYLKQVNQCWYLIFQVVKENCSVEYGRPTPQDDMMEILLNSKK